MGGSGGGTGGTSGASGNGMGEGNCGPDGGVENGTGGWGGPDEGGECEGQGAGGVGQYPGESAEERKARLEKTLEESVGGFDEVLAEEQREISTVGRNTEGFGGSGGGGGSGRVGLGKQSTGGNVEGAGQVATVERPDAQAEASVAGMSEEDIRERTPEDIPDLVAEDIVAKQLREAALSEDDPVLRERLWEEYRLYNDL
jgi:hypothetical protein